MTVADALRWAKLSRSPPDLVVVDKRRRLLLAEGVRIISTRWRAWEPSSSRGVAERTPGGPLAESEKGERWPREAYRGDDLGAGSYSISSSTAPSASSCSGPSCARQAPTPPFRRGRAALVGRRDIRGRNVENADTSRARGQASTSGHRAAVRADNRDGRGRREAGLLSPAAGSPGLSEFAARKRRFISVVPGARRRTHRADCCPTPSMRATAGAGARRLPLEVRSGLRPRVGG